ncbi:hypothetical protein NQU59_15185 [Acinetobacter colistiniresistens]|uniref:hypothetical protein n=1 Tax=Acinetobacter colistiniresistens TaxID=280145 RepID=UPI00211C9321|nr:hypothetical protein [Acinetobacter colistiniresistens]UUM27003.1 hypothetical protein NQU59_15185 [Acinetobacter colistiniresistens]
MENQLVDFYGSVLISLLVIGLILLLYTYIYNLLFIKKNSKELSEKIYGIEEYLDEVGISFEKVLQLNFIISMMWFSYFITYKHYEKMPYFAKRGEKVQACIQICIRIMLFIYVKNLKTNYYN